MYRIGKDVWAVAIELGLRMIITDGLAADTAAHIIATCSAFDSKHEARLAKDLHKRTNGITL